MRRLLPLSILIVVIFLYGCSSTATAPLPTSTSTQRFIRVASPTGGVARTAKPSSTPTKTSTQRITGTPPTAAPTETLTPTSTPTSTPTPTPTPETVAQLPDPFGYSWQQVVSGLNHPEGLVNAGDGSGRLFVIEQTGLLRILSQGALLPAPFLDLTQKIDCCGEKGLLGLAFHPNYTENGYFYVDYTAKQGSKLYTIISRFSVSASDPNQADPNSEKIIMKIEQPFQNHNGGQLQFGPDKFLYIGMGDGGSEGDPLGNGQSVQTLLGKILRIDVDSGDPYGVPSDNPFVNGGGLWEIWDDGLRNPWRFSFDKQTGDLYIGDVGQDAWEEIDYLPAGSAGGTNFGWSYFEGSHPYRGSPPAGEEFVMPVAEYSHNLGEAVIGGYVYRGKNLPDWQGVYIYGDYGSGRVWGLLHLKDGSWQNALMFETGRSISSFGVDETGEIYLVDDKGSILMLK
jgi:glucose/arabinose dehydrogenase